MPMDPRDKWRLRSNRLALIDINTEEVCPHMIAAGILTPDDEERIEKEATHNDKAQSFLNSLESKGEMAYSTFKETLLKLERGDLVRKLDSTNMNRMPARLQQELDAMRSATLDSTDRGNIIITDNTTTTRRQTRMEDEGAAESRRRPNQPKRSSGSITVRGNGNLVMDNSTVTVNRYW